MARREKRAEEKIAKLKVNLHKVKEESRLQQKGTANLEGFGEVAVELIERMNINIFQGSLTKKAYSPQLRCFALTLHFYSPRAYEFVRDSFQNVLPSLSVIRSWYNTIDAEPGFSVECFNALRLKKEEYKVRNKDLICALVMDEMGIKKGYQRGRDGIMRGNVDVGANLSIKSDELHEAKDALVLMVVPLNDNWKLPIGFFLINGLSADAKAELITQALIRLHEVGVRTVSLTLDEPADHFSAVKKLGAIMTMDEQSKPLFPHPVSGEPDVHVVIDACHDLKNIRNALGDLSVIKDSDNNDIKWQYIVELALLQQKEGLNLGNKLPAGHIEYSKMKMKVYLAAQTLSSSVADAIEYCDKELKLPQFQGCEATLKFIRTIDYLFDFLNVRNPWCTGFKSPLKTDNEHIWRPQVTSALEYLAGLKTSTGSSISSSRRKTGFIGFYTAALSVVSIYDEYVKPENGSLKYLLSYKLSQDHLELFFAAVRARSGWCPNPTLAQFISAYKRLLIRHDVQVSSGNTKLMDKTKIFNVSSSNKNKVAKIDRYDPEIYNVIENKRVAIKYGLGDEASNIIENDDDNLDEYLNFSWAAPSALTDFSINAVAYIAGFVVRKLSKTLKCNECILGCKLLSSTANKDTALIFIKTRGGLIVPSSSVITICSTAERLFRKACNGNMGKPPIEKNFPAVLANRAFHDLLLSKNDFFPELKLHFRNSFISDSCIDHMSILIKHILMNYIEIRMYSSTKRLAHSVTGTNIRHFLTRKIVWAHQ